VRGIACAIVLVGNIAFAAPDLLKACPDGSTVSIVQVTPQPKDCYGNNLTIPADCLRFYCDGREVEPIPQQWRYVHPRDTDPKEWEAK